MVPTPTREYFLEKLHQPRKKISDQSGLELKALEVALRVYRLHYPDSTHAPYVYHFYWNNAPKKHKEWVVADVYFLSYGWMREDGAFIVEVTFISRYSGIAIVRWRNMNELIAPVMVGETVVNC